jgi:hypothetical protein
LDPQLITQIYQISQAGVGVVALIAVVVLWRQSITDRRQFELDRAAIQLRYEAVLERCITALVRVNDHLEVHADGENRS